MELTPLRYLVAIADTGHMTRAAESLGVGQPALSAAVKKLEDELGVVLFDRTARGVEPTDACRSFLLHARAALGEVDAGREAVRALAGLEEGTIRVGGGATATGYLLPDAVAELQRVHPHLRFSVREAGSETVAQAILSGELDLGVVTLPVRAVGSGELMVVRRITDELRLLVPPGHALSTRRSFRWSDLVGEGVIAFEGESAVRAVLDEAAGAHGVSLNVVVELRAIESIRRMVHAGVGVGFVSRFALGEEAGDEQSGLTCRDGRIVRELAVVRRRDRQPSPAAAAFERVLLDKLPD